MASNVFVVVARARALTVVVVVIGIVQSQDSSRLQRGYSRKLAQGLEFIGDVVKAVIDEQEAIIKQLASYISGDLST